MKRKKILFFTKGSAVTPGQKQLGKFIHAEFRNAAFAIPGVIEPCDYVIGDFPEWYSEVEEYDAKDARNDVREAIREAAEAQETDEEETEEETEETDEETEEETDEETEEETDDVDLEAMSKAELLEYAEEEGIEVSSRLTVAKLREAIAEAL